MKTDELKMAYKVYSDILDILKEPLNGHFCAIDKKWWDAYMQFGQKLKN